MGKNEKTGLGRALVKHHDNMIQKSKEKGNFYRNQQKKVLKSVTDVNDIVAVTQQVEEAEAYPVPSPLINFTRVQKQPILPETSLSFFRIVFPSTIEDKKLMIPRKLVRKIGCELSDVAAIRIPNGRVWEVRLTKHERRVWFDDGWQNFVESNSISPGYFLIFRYGKNSTFHVLIFDVSACEIDYPCNDEEYLADGQSLENEDETEREDCVEISKESFAENYSPPTQLNQPKPTYYARGIKTNCQSAETKAKLGCEIQCQKYKRKRKLEEIDEENNEDEFGLRHLLKQMEIYISEKFKYFSTEESKRAIKVVNSLKLKNPSFMVILPPSRKSCRSVYVPALFTKKFINQDIKVIHIQLSNGSELAIQICWRVCGGFFLSKGWTKISKHKKWKEGDICIFELIRMRDILFKLHVFCA